MNKRLVQHHTTSASFLASVSWHTACLAASLLQSGDTTSPTAKNWLLLLTFPSVDWEGPHLFVILEGPGRRENVSTETEPGENDSKYQNSKWGK